MDNQITPNPSVPSQVVAEVKFPKFINNLGIIPTSYKDSMSYYETLTWLCKFLEEQVIPTVNENGNAVEELQALYIELNSYVTNYFDNLDVQEEINNKLDEMTESGYFDNLLNNYLQLTKVYNTITELLQSNETFVVGEKIKTLGYYSINDGGGANYLIRSKTNDDIEDNGSIHFIGSNLVAELILTDKLNVKQFGAKGINEDDTQPLKKLFEFVKNNEKINIVYFPTGSYKISDTILENGINGLQIIGSGRDNEGNLRTKIMRTADVTILNVSGTMTLTGKSMVSQVIIKNIYFTDSNQSFTENPAIKYNYAMYCLMQDCLIANYNKSMDFKNFYDSRFINVDFTGGGNHETNDGLITIHCGKHASQSEIGWDNTNWIVFDMCRFERYRGSAIKTIEYTQPPVFNQNYDPCVGVTINKIYLDKCKFESPYLVNKPVLDFNDVSSLYLNIEITVLDGQTNMEEVINMNKLSIVYGYAKVGYYETTVNPDITYYNFSNPIIKLYNCSQFDLTLLPGHISNRYQLDYLIDITANDLSYRTININVPYSYKKKKIFNSSLLPLNPGKQGIIDTYGESSNNGLRMLYDNTLSDEWRIATQFSNNKHQLRFLYKYGSNPSVIPILLNGDENGVSNIQLNSLLTLLNGINLSRDTAIQSNTSRTNRYIGYGSTAPTEGFWIKGDIIYNNNPSSGGNVGWVCTSGGSNATWNTFGTIS